MITMQGNNPTYYGESTDTKPLDVSINTKFKELDTGDTYFYDGSDWVKIGG